MVSEHAVIFWLGVLVGCALSVAALVAFVIVRTWWIAIRPSQEFRMAIGGGTRTVVDETEEATMNHLCPHKQNPKTCLTCFRMPKAPPQQAAPKAVVEPNLIGAPMGRIPGSHGGPAPVIGDRSGANIGVAVSGQPPVDEEAKERYRYPRGRPQQAPGMHVAQPQPRTTQSAGTYDQDGHWVADARPNIIDELPQHPNAPIK